MRPHLALLSAPILALALCLALAPTAQAQLTAAQRAAIVADLDTAQLIGVRHVRFITFSKIADPAYATWPDSMFLSWPVPKAAELANLAQFFRLAAATGLSYEALIVLPDSKGLYYENGVTSADYRAFLDAIWPALWAAPQALSRIYLGGDLRLGDHDPDPAVAANHRQWVLDLWPYLVAKCPNCALGLELSTSYASFWDRGADSAAWVRAQLARQPDFLGFEFYPTTHAALQALGFEQNGVVDWTAATLDWTAGLRAAAGPIPLIADEIGLAVGGEFTAQDQSDFLGAAMNSFAAAGIDANIWEFGDHPAIGDFGLMTQCRAMRPAIAALSAPLAAARAAGTVPGIQYIPPEYDDLAWLMPGGTQDQISCTP